jgi:hypothetical protein
MLSSRPVRVRKIRTGYRAKTVQSKYVGVSVFNQWLRDVGRPTARCCQFNSRQWTVTLLGSPRKTYQIDFLMRRCCSWPQIVNSIVGWMTAELHFVHFCRSQEQGESTITITGKWLNYSLNLLFSFSLLSFFLSFFLFFSVRCCVC